MKPIEYARRNQTKFLSELNQFLSIPSISPQEKYKPIMKQAAGWLKDRLIAAGFSKAEIKPTPGHPVVYAEWLAAGPDAPTILIYGHYDVQPPDPELDWHTPPFAPTLVGSDLFARGASDDKGQMYTHIKAVESFKETVGKPPINIKCIFEGEEEVASVNLAAFIRKHKKMLKADIAVISDTHILDENTPAIVYGLRGISFIQVEVTGPSSDLHSGRFGGGVHNPVHALSTMIASLHDEHGRVAIPGFYDKVRDLDDEERNELAKVPFDRDEWLKSAGVKTDWGDADYSIVERTSARPTLDVNGIWGGYIASGTKTIIPSKASAKISMRLVPDQESSEITQLIHDYLEGIAPPTVTVEVHDLHGGEGAIVRRDSPEMKAAFRAYTAGFGREPIFIREGGSVPVVATFQEVLGIETLLMGFGLPDDNLHAPNEKIHLPNFYRGIETMIHFFQYLGT